MNPLIKKVAKLEKKFSVNHYNGGGDRDFVIESGSIPIMISAPHAVNHYREGKMKSADLWTGGIARYLQEATNCHVIYRARYSESDPNYDKVQEGSYKDSLQRYIQENDIKVLIDLHGCAAERETAVDMGTVDDRETSLGQYQFIDDLFRITLEYRLESFLRESGKRIEKNMHFAASNANTITNYISRTTGIPCIQLEINRLCRQPEQEETFAALVSALEEAIRLLSEVKWAAKETLVLKARRSKAQFPQDKVEFLAPSRFGIRDVLIVRSDVRHVEQAMRYSACSDTCEEDCIYLTNRLIEALFGREPFENRPVLLHVCESEHYEIGRPVVEEQEIALTESVYQRLTAEKCQYIIYNKYANTKYFLRPKNYGYRKEEKIFLPYYYRQLLDAEYPMHEIQRECFEMLLTGIEEQEDKAFLERFYTLNVGEEAYVLSSECTEEEAKRLEETEKKYIGSNPLVLLKVPVEEKADKNCKKGIGSRLGEALLNLYIGCTRYDLRVCRPMPTDDKNYVARLSSNMMQLLGVGENDKITVSFGEKQVTLRVLGMEFENSDMMIGLPAKARKELGLCGINDVVSVKRNMRHIFLRNMSQQVFAVLGSVLTVTTLSDNVWFQWIVGILLAPLTVYLVLSEERLRGKG